MDIRDHKPITIDKFLGLWSRGPADSCPIDHFQDCDNVQYNDNNVKTRDGINAIPGPGDIIQAFKYKSPSVGEEGYIVLDVNGDFWFQTFTPDVTYGPILSVPTATDFAFIEFNGRAYISPITGVHGTIGEFLYVYDGDISGVARKAAGTGVPGSAITAANGAAGFTDAGQHIFAVVGETDTGYLSPPTGMVAFVTGAALSVSFSTVPVFTGSFWVRRHLVATRRIFDYNGDLSGYQFYFIPGATINDNTTTVLANQSFYDIELLEDASHLFDNFEEIPAGAVLFRYNGRLGIANGDFGEGVAYLSAPGEPEAIDEADGALVPPETTDHITNGIEYRDVLYLFKTNRTLSYIDNGDVPALWTEPTIIDNGIGCGFHGIGFVLDSKGVNVEFFIVAHESGLYLFTGAYIKPELSWKIATYWSGINGSNNRTQVYIDTTTRRIFIVLYNGRMLMGDFKTSLDYKNIKWTPWSFDIFISTILILNGPRLILGSSGNV